VADIVPPELARLADIGERPRSDRWSLRAALTRYGQPRAQLASDVTEVVRRVEGALKPWGKTLEREGNAVWAAVVANDVTGEHAPLVALLGVASDLDEVGDALAVWASDITLARPDAAVEAAVPGLAARLDALGVPREEGPPRQGRRRGV
jgi:hypothetical protein